MQKNNGDDAVNEGAVLPENKKKYGYTQKITISAMMIAIAAVVTLLTRTTVIPINGSPVFRVSFSGSFIHFIALIFGPAFGGAVGAAADVVNYFVKPEGSFLIYFTIVAFFKGASIGFLWKVIKNVNSRLFNFFYFLLFGFNLVAGAVNLFALRQNTESAYSLAVLNIIGKRADPISIGMIICGLIGFAAWIALRIISARTGVISFEKCLKIIVAIGVPGLIFTSVNTWIIMAVVLNGGTAFMVLWIPRILGEMVTILFNTYLLAAMLGVYEKAFKTKIG